MFTLCQPPWQALYKHSSATSPWHPKEADRAIIPILHTRKVKCLTSCLTYRRHSIPVKRKPFDEFKVCQKLKWKERPNSHLPSPVPTGWFPGLCWRQPREPGTMYIQPPAQFTVTAEINRVELASCARQLRLPRTPHSYLNVPAKGP